MRMPGQATPSFRRISPDKATDIKSILPASKFLSDAQAQRVKGSCFFFLFALIGLFVQSVVTIAAGVVAGISAVVAAVSAVIAPLISAIGTAIISGVTDLLVGMSAQIYSAIQFVGVSLFSGAGSFLGGTLFTGSTAATGATATGFSLTGLGAAIGKTVVLGALSFGVTRGLESLGVNPVVSGLIGSFLTGGISGIFSGGLTTAAFISGGLQGLAVQGVNAIGQRLGLDPALTSIIGLGAGALIGASLNGVKMPMYDSAGQILKDSAGEVMTYTLTGLDAINQSLSTTILPNMTSSSFFKVMCPKSGLISLCTNFFS